MQLVTIAITTLNADGTVSSGVLVRQGSKELTLESFMVANHIASVPALLAMSTKYEMIDPELKINGRRIGVFLSAGQIVDVSQIAVYRGIGDDGIAFKFKPSDFKIKLVDGKEMIQPSHGISLFTTPETLNNFPDIALIESIPEGLCIKQRASKLNHCEIVPCFPMEISEFQNLLSQIVIQKGVK